MRYHFNKPEIYVSQYGKVYLCDHLIYSRCTLFQIDQNGLAVIQQRRNPADKTTWWGEIDAWLTDSIYLNTGFRQFFNERGGPCINGLYPTVTVRQIMWALKMKPIPKERWETVFDRKDL